MDLDIDGDAALVAASSSGLGKAAATALAREGANVVMNGRDRRRLDDAIAAVRETADGEIVAAPGDLTDPDDVTGLVETTVDAFGGVDHLVTNAGGPPSGPFLDTDDEDWYRAFDLLVMSVVRLVRESADHLRDGSGSVVNITSMTVKEATDSLVLSNSVRMGVIGLEKTLSREFAPDVRVNAVLPGAHETARTQELVQQGIERGDYADYESGIDARYSDIPLGIGDPMDLGDAVAFLCSPRASNITGIALPVDGGASRSNL